MKTAITSDDHFTAIHFTMLLLICNLVVSAILTGLIWFVQVVHYPIFLKVPSAGFKEFQAQHMQTTTYVVAFPMLAELLLSGMLLMQAYPGKLPATHYTAFACVMVIWAVTFFISVPIHNQLVLSGYNAVLIKQLVATNWLRTIFWTIRTGILVFMVWRAVTSREFS